MRQTCEDVGKVSFNSHITRKLQSSGETSVTTLFRFQSPYNEEVAIYAMPYRKDGKRFQSPYNEEVAIR